MARPYKKGLDYFPMSTAQDKEMYLIQKHFGKDGYYITVKLFCEIFREEGYFTKWDEYTKQYFTASEDIDEDVMDRYIDYAIKIRLFDKNMYERFGILTSERIQELYFTAVAKRKNVQTDERYLLIDVNNNKCNEICDGTNSVNAYTNSADDCTNEYGGEINYDNGEKCVNNIKNIINDGINPINNSINTQIKENKNKTNKNKSYENKSYEITENKYKRSFGINPEKTVTDDSAVFSAYKEGIGDITPAIVKKLRSYMPDIEVDVVVHAIEKTVSEGILNPTCIYAILDDYKKKGITTLAEALYDDRLHIINSTNSYEDIPSDETEYYAAL